MYTEKVMDHFEHPRNVGEIENPSGMGTVGNPKCGDIMRIYLDIDENQVIRDVKCKTFVLCWQRKQSMRPSGIMHRKTVLPLRA